MLVNGEPYRTIWLNEDDESIVQIIDQRHLPHHFVIEDLASFNEILTAIKDMHVRGAGLIGATAGYGMYLAVIEASESGLFDKVLQEMSFELKKSRPTAVNLEWAVNRQWADIDKVDSLEEKIKVARTTAQLIADEDASFCQSIGIHGVRIMEEISQRKRKQPVNILTHCNAGWLAFTDYGTATSPIYEAFNRGIDVHVWVDETRPRNQGASLTAWELLNQGVPHTIIADNTGGYLMQKGMVDLVITGADRVTVNGDVANKIGTYLKALSARDNNIPFYVAIPSSTIDWNTESGEDIPIEKRGEEEVKYIQGRSGGKVLSVLLTPEDSPALNYGFDITPARLVTGLITERGICAASENELMQLFPEYSSVR